MNHSERGDGNLIFLGQTYPLTPDGFKNALTAVRELEANIRAAKSALIQRIIALQDELAGKVRITLPGPDYNQSGLKKLYAEYRKRHPDWSDILFLIQTLAPSKRGIRRFAAVMPADAVRELEIALAELEREPFALPSVTFMS